MGKSILQFDILSFDNFAFGDFDKKVVPSFLVRGAV
jgi:hypothetical protein